MTRKPYIAAAIIALSAVYVFMRPTEAAVVIPSQPVAAGKTAVPQTNSGVAEAVANATSSVVSRITSIFSDDGEGDDDAPRKVVANPTPKPVTTPAPKPTPAPTPTPTPVVQNSGKYKNGVYTGASVDAYYGFVQVKATISNGKLADVTFLSYPSDRSTSRYINSQAMPILTQQAIAAQSAQVNGVSGATATSDAFVQSLSGALTQAS